MSYEINQKAIQIIGEDRVPEDVLLGIIRDFGSDLAPSIRREFPGGSELVTFSEFAEGVVQNEEVAVEIAEQMLAGEEPYEYNASEPEFREVFTILSRAELEEQLLQAQAELS